MRKNCSKTYPQSLSLGDQTSGPRPPPAARSCTNTYGKCLPSCRQCLLNVKKTVPNRYSTRHLWQHRWCWPGGSTLGVPLGRKAWAGFPCKRRVMSSAVFPQHRQRQGLRPVGPEKNPGGCAEQHPAHRPACKKPAEGPAQALSSPQPPPGGRLLGTPRRPRSSCQSRPRLRFLPFF